MQNPLDQYQSVEKATLTGRELESHILLKSAQKLAEAKRRLESDRDLESLDEALRYNQRLWTLFQSELMDPGNPLPQEIKENLLALIGFIDRRTFSLMAEPDAARIDVLIEINRNIASGLQGQVGTFPAQDSA
jgi:flagellar protein FlaF